MTVARLESQVTQTQQSVASTETTLTQQREAATQTTTASVQADEVLAAAQAAFDDAKAKAEAAQAEEDAALLAVSQSEETLAGLMRTLTDAGAMLEATMQQLTSAADQATSLESAVAVARTEWITQQQSLEDVLESQGAWVSFSEVVAPVLYTRCLACHNARTAQGRLNLESYAALMKGGESGEAVIPGDNISSLLQIMIEDHSMPKDADPLTDEQIAAIGHWIEVGAPLDAGIEDTTPLIQAMPKLATTCCTRGVSRSDSSHCGLFLD